MSKSELKNIAIFLMIIAGVICVGIIISSAVDGFAILGHGKIDFSVTGQFGDFIGGFVGTIISAAGFFFLYLTLKEQRESTDAQSEAFIKERFESNFFELVKLHKENVTQLFYAKQTAVDKSINYSGRQVIGVIFQEFLECLKEVRKYDKMRNIDDVLLPRYKNKLLKIIHDVNPQINIAELVQIDIAYSIVFFGVEDEGEIILRDRFKYQFVAPFIYKLLKYIKLKPNKGEQEGLLQWLYLQAKPVARIRTITDELYNNRNNLQNADLSDEATDLIPNITLQKYYSGHHHQLGHYYRHLFQSYKYLNTQEGLKDVERYFYGKTLRAQLSTYEQALLFINSISSLGRKWEYQSEKLSHSGIEDWQNKIDTRLITKYHIIKNLPGNHFFGLTFKRYYPNVKYEANEYKL